MRPLLIVLLLAIPAIVSAQGANATEQVVQEDALVRIIRTSVPAKSEVAIREHPDALVVSLPQGTVSWLTPATRALQNNGADPLDVLIVELKTAPAAVPKLVLGNPAPAPRPGLGIRNVFDNEHVTVDLYTLAPGYKEAAPHPHTWESVFIQLRDNDMQGAGPGAERKQWTRGELAILPAAVQHAFGNLGEAPAEFLYVRLK